MGFLYRVFKKIRNPMGDVYAQNFTLNKVVPVNNVINKRLI